MFDIGWSEMMVVAMLALIIIGPKDLPRLMRSVAHWVRKAQSLAREFQSGLDDMVREADLEDAKKLVDTGRSLNVKKIVEDVVDPTGSVRKEAEDLRSTVATKPAASPSADKSKAEEGKTEESKVKTSKVKTSKAKTSKAKTSKAKTSKAKTSKTKKSKTAAAPEPENPAPETAAAGAGDGADAPKATIIEHPVQVAPPHSITPPAEPEGAAASAAKGDDNSQKTA